MPLPHDHAICSLAPESDRGAKEELLGRVKWLGVSAWHDPLLCLPKAFLDCSRRAKLKDAAARADIVGSECVFSLVAAEKAVLSEHPRKRLTMNATDGMLPVRIAILDIKSGPWKQLEPGQPFHALGTLQNWGGTLQLTAPHWIEQDQVGKVVPLYESRRGVAEAGALYQATRHALTHHLDATVAHLIASYEGLSEAEILRRARLGATSVAVVLKAAHAPTSLDEGVRGLAALRRLAALSIVENARRLKHREPQPESVVDIPATLLDSLIAQLPHSLTGDQATAVREIVADMASPIPMRRVLSGDVGSGKTLPIMLVALATQRLGRRAVILTPNGVLAEQFLTECKGFFGESTPVVAVTATTRKLNLEGNPILVGTTALLSRLNGQAAPAFLAVDEEQKMSVAQKGELTGSASNYLQATATPIPRTTALITHGAMDVSIIREMPVAKSISSHIVTAAERRRLFEHTRRVLNAGGQVAIIYPIVKDVEQEKKSVVAAVAEWERHFPQQVGMLHGQMKETDKLVAVEALKSGKHKIAVVSSVVEIGLTFPSLRSLIVVHAERYGTSTLHQFRGRVARHGGVGSFFMYLPNKVTEDTMRRLRLVERHGDGFTLSEKDAELRGYGDLFAEAERQSGNSRSTIFRCIDLTPAEILGAARALATPIAGAHPVPEDREPDLFQLAPT